MHDATDEYALTEEQHQVLQLALNDLAVQAEAEAVLLCDNGGNILASVERGANGMLDTVAALAAGSFAATRELAVLLGEQAFTTIFHQGANRGILMRSAVGAFLVIAVFDRCTTAGLVKLFVGKTLGELEPVLAGICGQPVRAAGGDSVFGFDDEADTIRGIPARDGG